jgi:aspartate/glutamate racemase
VATLGIVGGLGPESTIDYYRRILEERKREFPSTQVGAARHPLHDGRSACDPERVTYY